MRKKARGFAPGPHWGHGPQTPIHQGYIPAYGPSSYESGFGAYGPNGSRAAPWRLTGHSGGALRPDQCVIGIKESDMQKGAEKPGHLAARVAGSRRRPTSTRISTATLPTPIRQAARAATTRSSRRRSTSAPTSDRASRSPTADMTASPTGRRPRRGITPVVRRRVNSGQNGSLFAKRLDELRTRVEQTIGETRAFRRVAMRCEKIDIGRSARHLLHVRVHAG